MAINSQEIRRKNMRAVKSTGSKIEVALAKRLWACGYRYRKNDRSILGKPDLTLKCYKLAIFVDSEFWHGKDWDVRKHDHKSNVKFWINKIENNIKRDTFVTEMLRRDGWTVIRFWGRDVIKNLNNCIEIVNETVNEIKRKNYY